MQQKGNLIQKLAVCYLIVWTISPPLGIDMKYRLLALGAVGAWALFAVTRRYYIENTHLYSLVFALAVVFVAYFEYGNIEGILNQIAIYILVICFFMNAFYMDRRWHELSGIVLVVLILLIVFNHRTAEILAEDPSIARRIVRADEEMFPYMRQGIGGYGLIYPQVCIFPAILAWIISSFRKNMLCFVIGCIWLITFVQCVLNSGYSIAIYVSALGAIMLFFYKRKNSTGAIIVSGIVFAGFMMALVYSDGFRESLLNFFDGTEVATKINDMMATNETGAAEGSIQNRMTKYITSVDVMFQYPFLGSLWHSNGGGHSAILDIFAKYGVLGGYVFVKMLFYVPEKYKNQYRNEKIYSVSNAVIVSILYISMLNSFPYNFMCMIILVLPLLYEDIMKWEGIK